MEMLLLVLTVIMFGWLNYGLAGSAISILALIYLFFRERFKYWEKRGVPYLKPIIPFGNALDLFLGRITFGELFSRAYLEFKKQGHRHGGIYFLWRPLYVPVDEEIVKRILISDFDYFANHGFFTDATNDHLTNHIFNLDGFRWKSVRTKFPAAFTSAKMRQMFQIMEELTNVFIGKLEKTIVNLGAEGVEIKSELTRLTTDVISACAFGIDSNTMNRENADLIRHGRLFFDYQWNLPRLSTTFLIPPNILKSIRFKVFKKETEAYVGELFDNIKQHRLKSGLSRNDLADIIVNMTKTNVMEKDFDGKHVMDPISDKEFIAQMFLFFCAGFETSSSTLTFALYELAKHNHCQKKLRDEINTVLKTYDGKLTYDAVMDMKYLDNVVDETLRLYPIFPLVPRVCNKDYQVPGSDVVIEKNIYAMISNMGIQRDSEYYPDPERFEPERFLSENKASRPFVSYLPFGEGPRICVGKRFGLLQTKVGLIKVIRDYEVSLNKKTSGGCKFESNELILRKKGDVWLDLKNIG